MVKCVDGCFGEGLDKRFCQEKDRFSSVLGMSGLVVRILTNNLLTLTDGF